MKFQFNISTWNRLLRRLPLRSFTKPRIALLTLCTGERYTKAMQAGLRSKEEYCAAHGMDFILGGEEILDAARPPPWSKIKLIQKHLSDYDYVFFSDADVVMINHSIRLADIIREHMGRTDVMLTRDTKNNINTGNFFVRRSRWSARFLDRIYAQTEFIDHPWWENKAFIHLYETDPSLHPHIRVITEPRLFNTYIDPKDPYNLEKFPARDLLIHLAGFSWEGYSLDELEKVMHFCYAHRLPFSNDWKK